VQDNKSNVNFHAIQAILPINYRQSFAAKNFHKTFEKYIFAIQTLAQ